MAGETDAIDFYTKRSIKEMRGKRERKRARTRREKKQKEQVEVI